MSLPAKRVIRALEQVMARQDQAQGLRPDYILDVSRGRSLRGASIMCDAPGNIPGSVVEPGHIPNKCPYDSTYLSIAASAVGKR